MDNTLSTSESRMMHVHGGLSQAINNKQLSESPSLKQPSSENSADISTSTSSSSPLSLISGRPRRRPIPRKGHTKSRRGCFNCKRRRVKCQETTPSCDNCNRLSLGCEYPQTSDNGLLYLPSPQPGQPISEPQLSMVDLRFFHHFLLHAYPGLPIQGEDVWKEVAKYSHGFDFLAHAMLAVGASHLGLCNGTDYNSDAISHRVKAIKSLNSALSTPCQTKEEGDARYATLMALTWQSSYMADGMQEFLSMLRGCTIVSKCSVFQFEDSVFRIFSIEGHVQRVNDINNGFDIGLSDHEAIDAGIASIKAIAPLGQSTLEISLAAALQSILEMSRSTCVGAFGAVCRAYQLFGGASDSDFLTISDADNHVAQIIMAHFFAIEAKSVGLRGPIPASNEITSTFVHPLSSSSFVKMVERKFQIIDRCDFNRTYHGIAISEQWQAWETAHFFRFRSIIENPTVGARLISYGCDNGDSSSLNCTTTCSNAKLMYYSPENLWNCMTLATLGILVGPGNDTIDRESEKKMDGQFHFGTVEKFNSLNVFRKVRDCSWASCSDSTYGSCTSSLQVFKCGPVSPDNIAKFGRVMSKPYCQAASAGIDLVIAEQGMADNTVRNTLLKSCILRYARLSRIPALFAATISITAIITFDGGNRAGLANMLTLFSWMFNHRILQGLVTAGMYPVLMAQLVMHRAGERRFYTLFFVVLSWVLMTMITEFQDFNTDSFEQQLKQVWTVDACGGNPGPMSFCQGIKKKNSYDFFTVTLESQFAIHVIVSCLIVDWAVHFAKTRMIRDTIKYTQIGGNSPSIFSFAETKGAKLLLLGCY
ncbi:hypothetical protein FACUT_9860 [Fusarium acutatum]|uniref:Zn(2)-C6 fungal-type domain-containing protein n=1 Tax=Fusarium acutatum TaxID=78861 RepID=A0A8H4JJF6_9HYPO|nr:hypothetical protein FACUT_9860 [Fusarium acutatum]